MSFRYANGGSSDRTFDLLVDGSTVSSDISMASTSLWTTWSTTTVSGVYLSSGSNKIRIEATTSEGLANIDYVKIIGASSITGESCSGVKSASGTFANSGSGQTSLYPNPVGGNKLTLYADLESSAEVAVEVYNYLGVRLRSEHFGILEKGAHTLSVDVSGLASGAYILKMEVNGNTETYSFIKN